MNSALAYSIRMAISQNYSGVLHVCMKIYKNKDSCEELRRKNSYKNTDHLTWWHMKTFVTCEPTFADDILSRFISNIRTKLFQPRIYIVGTYLCIWCCIVLVLFCVCDGISVFALYLRCAITVSQCCKIVSTLAKYEKKNFGPIRIRTSSYLKDRRL